MLERKIPAYIQLENPIDSCCIIIDLFVRITIHKQEFTVEQSMIKENVKDLDFPTNFTFMCVAWYGLNIP